MSTSDHISIGMTLALEFVADAPKAFLIPMYIGKYRCQWAHLEPRGSCVWCLGQCDGHRCGTHAYGCFYVGGHDYKHDYWVYHPLCELYHG